MLNMPSSFQWDTVAWIIAAYLTLYYSEIVTVLKIDPRIDGAYFHISLATSALTILIALYFIVWLSCIKGIDSSKWERHAPFAIPVACASAVVSGVFWNLSLWSVYGYLTPVIIFILFMGFVMMVSIFPSWPSGISKESAGTAEEKSD